MIEGVLRLSKGALIMLIIRIIYFCFRYCSEFSMTVLIARKMAYQCAKKITHLVLETDAFMAGPSNSNHNSNSGT